MKPSAIGYVRVSTERQAEEGFGLAVQVEAVRACAKASGLRLSRIIREEGVSGAVEERPGLADLLQAAGPGVVVLVPRLDRLARDLLTQEILVRDIRRRGAELLSCSKAETDYLADDPDDPTRKLIRQVLGAVSEFERALIKLRLTRGRRAKANAGGYAYGAPPYGTRAAEGELLAEPEEQKAIRLAKRLQSRGRSLREIGRALEEGGYQPRRGKRWHPQVVSRILARGD